jgi:pimeloyl-ACP methyl ester carboxylesterase
MKLALRVVAVLLILLVAAGAIFYRYPLWVADQQTRFTLWRAGVRSDYVEVEGYRLHYFEATPPGGGGTPLVLVHGLGGRAEDWAPMIPALARRGFHVYAPDLLGYGRSPRPDVTYSIPMQETVVIEFMKAMNVPKADVGGWSMGGWVSLRLALDHPELVNRLVVYDSAGIYFPAKFRADLFTPTDIPGVRELLTTLTPKPVVLPEFAGKAILRKLNANAWVVKRSMSAMTSGRDLLDFRLHEIQLPTLIVWGAKDELIPLSVGETMHRDIPNSVLDVIEGCGHLAPGECWQPATDATVDFLRSEPAMQGGERTFPAPEGFRGQ